MIELSASSSTHSKTRLTSNIAGQRLCFGQTGGSTGYTPLWYAYMTHNPGTSASYSASDSCLELAALLLLYCYGNGYCYCYAALPLLGQWICLYLHIPRRLVHS